MIHVTSRSGISSPDELLSEELTKHHHRASVAV